MHSPSAAEWLGVWERGRTAAPWKRALVLLAAAEPETPVDVLASLSIGRRDALLLRLRERTFGPSLEGMATCPGCGEQMELAVVVADLLGGAGAEGESAAQPPLWLDVEGYGLRFRLPTSADLAAVDAAGDAVPAALLARCVEGVAGGEPTLAPQLAAAVAARMAEADPLADLELALTCAACGERWAAPFDITAFFWVEIDAWARRTLREVHRLASSYGWSESAILALTPLRRQAYLELIGT